MISTHVARRGVASVPSPLDVLADLTPVEVQAALDATRALTEGADSARPGAAPCAVN